MLLGKAWLEYVAAAIDVGFKNHPIAELLILDVICPLVLNVGQLGT